MCCVDRLNPHRLAALGHGLGVNAIPWAKQILEVFAFSLAEHNGRGLKSLWVKCCHAGAQ